MQHWIPAALAAAVLAAGLSARIGSLENHLVEHIDRQINHLRKVITVSAQDTVNALAAQVRKGISEVTGKIAELQAAADAGQPVDLTELAAAAQALDDIVADAPVVEPEPEPVVEDVVEVVEDVVEDVVSDS